MHILSDPRLMIAIAPHAVAAYASITSGTDSRAATVQRTAYRSLRATYLKALQAAAHWASYGGRRRAELRRDGLLFILGMTQPGIWTLMTVTRDLQAKAPAESARQEVAA